MPSTENVTNLGNFYVNSCIKFFISKCFISNRTEILPKIKQPEILSSENVTNLSNFYSNNIVWIFYKQLLYKQQYWGFDKN